MSLEHYDWNKWLAPARLPDTGAKDVMAGQVWAFHVAAHINCVIRILPAGGFGRVERLAGSWPTLKEISMGITWLYRAVLVQDVDQPEPTDPDLLYQAFYK